MLEKEPIPVAELRLQPFTTFEPNGVLLVCGSEAAHANPMTISWGMFGIMWGRPIMMVMVRFSRYTWDIITKMPDFTVNWLPEDWDEGLVLCGTKSGRDHNKFAETGLTPISASVVQSPVIAESALSLECRTLYRTDMNAEAFIDKAIINETYTNGDFHGLFFGEIVAATGVHHFRQMA